MEVFRKTNSENGYQTDGQTERRAERLVDTGGQCEFYMSPYRSIKYNTVLNSLYTCFFLLSKFNNKLYLNEKEEKRNYFSGKH